MDNVINAIVCCSVRNCYTMGCPRVRGDNPRALASGLFYVQVYKYGIIILYHLHQCRLCTSRAKVGKVGIMLHFGRLLKHKNVD